ncbi:MAG TPA: hypothetical protein VK623_07515 [Flavobacterium sp.]|nr:hypothetical protein [Flavobacterium sp.]
MTIEKKITIIAIISVILTGVLFFLDSDPINESVFRISFELLLMAVFLFIIIAINYFAIAFCIKKARQYFKRNA